MKFIEFASQPKPQVERTLLYPHGPTNKKAWAQLTPAQRKVIFGTNLRKLSAGILTRKGIKVEV